MTDTTTEAQTPEPWSVWGNPYNGYFVWHQPTRKWLPVINDMADALDPDHPAAQNMHQISARAITAELIQAEAAPHLLCLGCLIEQHQGARTQPNPATAIVGGQSTCLQHLQFTDGPLIPGRTPSGIILGNGG